MALTFIYIVNLKIIADEGQQVTLVFAKAGQTEAVF